MIPYFSSCIPAFTYESMSTNEQSFHDEELYPDICPLIGTYVQATQQSMVTAC